MPADVDLPYTPHFGQLSNISVLLQIKNDVYRPPADHRLTLDVNHEQARKDKSQESLSLASLTLEHRGRNSYGVVLYTRRDARGGSILSQIVLLPT